MSGPLADFAGWVAGIVQSAGYVGVGGLVAAENLFPPIPSELILPLAGFLSGQGRLALPWVIVAATLGSVLGALILYGLGRWLGEDRFRGLVRDHGGWLFDEGDFDRARDRFNRHGNAAVLVGRLIPGIRSFISIPAGIERMPLAPFVLYTALGSALWDGALVLLGWWLGSRWELVERYGQYVEYGALVLLVVGVIWYVKGRWARKNSRIPTG